MNKEDLPTLTPAIIQRVKEGLAAARSPAVRHSIDKALARTRAIAQHRFDYRISGSLRRLILRFLIHSAFRIKVDFAERIPTEPAIIAANHLNHLDPFVILSELPAKPYYYILGDARTLANKWWKRLIVTMSGGAIPLERRWKEELAVIEEAKTGDGDLHELAQGIEQDVASGSDISTLRQINRAVEAIFLQGDGIILFPEGRLGGTEGQLHFPLKRGTAIYALRSGVPIIPVGLIGTKDLYLRKELTIRFGSPLQFPVSKRPKKREIDAVLTAVSTEIMALLLPDYQEPEGPKPLRYFLNHMLS